MHNLGRPYRMLLVGLALAANSCERQAPEPEQCQVAAARLLGILHSEQLGHPLIRAAFEEKTNECLTLPYDRVFVKCLESRRHPQICAIDFQDRRKMRHNR